MTTTVSLCHLQLPGGSFFSRRFFRSLSNIVNRIWRRSLSNMSLYWRKGSHGVLYDTSRPESADGLLRCLFSMSTHSTTFSATARPFEHVGFSRRLLDRPLHHRASGGSVMSRGAERF